MESGRHFWETVQSRRSRRGAKGLWHNNTHNEYDKEEYDMRKKLLGSMALGLCLVMGLAAPAMADSRKVVTLGADLSDDQKNTMMKYFGVSYDSVDVIYITNTDERNHLGSYVPLEQIGTHTFSCALVAPTSTGGIQVKTANLDWVTCNMIASTLSTSGVTNCQVVAASPFKVSGTGALTGVIMAYEQASGETLSQEKVELANQELVTTGNLANNVGQSKATAVINETKTQVIENNITNIEEITNIVNNVSSEYNVKIDNSQSEEIAQLMQKIAEQEYDITQLKATLDRVQANVAGDAGASEEEQQAAEEQAEASEEAALEAALQAAEEEGIEIEVWEDETENILENTDPEALDDGTATVEEVDTTQTVQEQSEAAQEETDATGIPVATDDGTIQTTESSADDGSVEIVDGQTAESNVDVDIWDDTGSTDQATVDTDQSTADSDAETSDTDESQEAGEVVETDTGFSADQLEGEDRTVYDEVKTDLDDAFLGAAVMADDGTTVYLTDDAAAELPEKIENYLVKVMLQGADAIAMQEASDAAISQTIVEDTAAQAPDKNYEDATLKQVDKYVRRLVFKDSENILADSQLTEDDETVLYNVIMQAFETAYEVEDTQEDAALDEWSDTAENADYYADDSAESYVDDTLSDEFADFDVEEGTF